MNLISNFLKFYSRSMVYFAINIFSYNDNVCYNAASDIDTERVH